MNRAPLSLPRRLGHGALATVAAVVVSGVAVRLLLAFDLSATALLLDTLAWLPVGLGIALASRRPAQAWVAMALLPALWTLGNAYKTAMMGAPVLTADLGNAVALLRVLPGWRWWLAWAVMLGAAVLLAWAFWPSRRRAAWLLLPVAWLATLVLLAPRIDRAFTALAGGDEPGMIERIGQHGLVVHLLRDGATRDAASANVPSREEVAAALATLGIAPASAAPGPAPRRNIHAFLLESLWDVTQLAAYRFDADPFDPRFRAAWERGGRSTILSPAFGGATANAEFEFLCGLPALRDAVTFEVGLRKPMPCLPRVLREAGYATVAVHPYHADFWNRDAAYPRVGFEAYRPIESFALQDMDGMFLADASLYGQVREWLARPGEDRPRFTYTVSLSSHYPFDRDRGRRPDRITVTPAAPMLQGYANAARYATEAFMDHVEALLAQDPDALIVAFGDHAPVLGVDPDPYLASGLDMRGAAERVDETYSRIARTPLLVIDGRRGVVPMGEVPLHRLAPRLLALLGPGAPRLPHAPPVADADDPTQGTRLFFAHLLARTPDGKWRVCRRKAAGCAEAFAVRESLVALRDDLMQGEQHALDLLHAERYAATLPTRVEAEHATCGLQVQAWGPKGTRAGEGFNVQPGGASAMWFQVSEARGKPSIEVGDTRVEAFIAGRSASANFGTPGFIARPGRYPVRWSCPDGSAGEIGEFVVSPATPAADAGLAPAPAPAPGVPAGADCGLAVEAWGPQSTREGQGFNLQADGRSALWFRFAAVQGEPRLLVDGQEAEQVISGREGSVVLPAGARLLREPGEYALGWRCPGGASGEIGRFATRPGPPAAPAATGR